MNIVVIGPFYPYRGGISDTNKELCETLINHGHNVEIINFKLLYPKLLFPGKTQFQKKNITTNLKSHRVLNTINPFNWFRVLKIIKEIKPDLIISTYWTGLLTPSYTLINNFVNNKIKKIGIIHNVVSHEKRPIEKYLLKLYLSKLDKYFTLSKNVLNQIQEISRENKGVKLFHPLPKKFGFKEDKIISKKTLHLNTEHEYILFFGLIREYKGLETLIKSMPKVLKLNPNLKLLIVGENYISMKKYNQLIEKLNISKNVIIKNTFIDDDKIKYWFSSSELVIIPYKKASQSGITSLSLQFEVPTVSSNIDGLNEVINDNITGYLFNSNYDELASKINYALKSDKKNMINNIIKIKKELTWESFITQMFKNI